jgi:hypothetical protein
MQKIKAFLVAVGIVLLLVTAVFLAIGGGQIINGLRGPALPTEQTASTPAGDLDYLRQVVLSNERGVADAKLHQFEKTIRSLTVDPPSDNDAASIIAARAMAQFDNAHSTLVDPRLHRLPIRVHWFADGLFIVKARPEWAKFAWAKDRGNWRQVARTTFGACIGAGVRE